jgi:type I restriction enzyme M protein
LPETNADQNLARESFDPIAGALRGLSKQTDLLFQLTSRALGLTTESPNGDYAAAAHRRRIANILRDLDEDRRLAVEQLRSAVYFHKQIAWLQDRFPDAVFAPVPGLANTVSRDEIATADWSLSPARYVGVAPPEPDDDLDFGETMRDLHVELADLNREASELATAIAHRFEELGL